MMHYQFPRSITRGGTFGGLARVALLAAFATMLVSPLAAKELATGTGAFIDLPSGFTPGDGDGKTRFSYFDSAAGMELDILIFEPGHYASAEVMAGDLLKQMGSKGDISSFTYQGRGAVIADLGFDLSGVPRKGYAVFITGTSETGYALVASAPTSAFGSYSELITSSLDAFSINRAARRFPGPVSQFLFPVPAARDEKKTIVLPGGSATLPWSSKEAQEELSIAEREYRILTLYLNTQTLWVDAWGRYYRMVYKESAAELDTLTQTLSKSLPANDPTETARKVLAWVQGFLYERDFSGIDFVPPLTAAFERRGDCDSRAMVMAIILERLGIDAVLMVSREYSHAMLAVDVPGGGQRFTYNGKAYLVAETTAKVGIGTMAADQADFSKWLGVDLGE
jgi:hypothetical protein